MFDTDSDTLRDTEPTETESPKASSADSDSRCRQEGGRCREAREAPRTPEAPGFHRADAELDDGRYPTPDGVQRDLGSVSDPQAEIESRIERNGMAYLMKDGAVYAVVLSSDDYERLADKKA